MEEVRNRIEKFEKSKQSAIDDTIVTTTLSTTQIYLWEDNHNLHPILNSQTDFLIIPIQHLIQLITRHWETTNEVKSHRKQLAELNLEAKTKAKKNRDLEETIFIEKQKCDELQQLKFGQKIDIGRLDKLSEEMATATKHKM